MIISPSRPNLLVPGTPGRRPVRRPLKFTPLSLTPAPDLWLEGGSTTSFVTTFLDTGRSTPQTTNGGNVKALISPGDTPGAEARRYVTQGTNFPTLSVISGRHWLAPGSAVMPLSSNISYASTDDWTIWAVMIGTGSAVENCIIGGQTGAVQAGVDIHADGILYLCSDSGYVQTGGAFILPNSPALVRVRKSGSTIYARKTGSGEATLVGSITGNFTWSDLWGRGGSGAGHVNTRTFGAIIMGKADYAAAIQARVEMYLYHRWGVAF
jgi:hypothetical protein